MAESIHEKVFPEAILVEGNIVEWHDGNKYQYTNSEWVLIEE